MPHGASNPPDWQSCCPMERVHFSGSERMLTSRGNTPAVAPAGSDEGLNSSNTASASHSLDCSSSGLHDMFVGSCSPLLAACLEGASDPGSQSPFARAQQQGGTTTTAEDKAASTSRPFFKTRLSSSKERAVSTAASPPRQRNISVRSHSVSGSSVKAQFTSLKAAAEMAATKGLAQGRKGQAERKATPLWLRPFPTEVSSPKTMQPRKDPTSLAEVVSPRSMQTILEEPTEPEAELPSAAGVSSPRSPHVQSSLQTSSRPRCQPVPKHNEPGSVTPPLQQGCPSASAQGSPRTPRRMLPGKTVRADVDVALELEKLMAPGRMSGVAQSLSQQLAKICKRWF